MTKEQILKALKSYHKGSFIKIQWETDITSASAKKQGYSAIKACESVVRLGVDYQHTRPAMQKQNTVHQESWFKHCEDSILMVNKKDCEKLYLQCFSSYFPLIKEIDAYIATPIKINNPIGPAIITHLLFKIILSFLYCL